MLFLGSLLAAMTVAIRIADTAAEVLFSGGVTTTGRAETGTLPLADDSFSAMARLNLLFANDTGSSHFIGNVRSSLQSNLPCRSARPGMRHSCSLLESTSSLQTPLANSFPPFFSYERMHLSSHRNLQIHPNHLRIPTHLTFTMSIR